MRLIQSMCVLMLAGAGLAGCCAGGGSAQQPHEMKIENLLNAALSDDVAADREVVVSYLEIPPGAKLERHWHPGEEFVYFLEGSGEVRIDGQAPITAEVGEVVHIPYKRLHAGVAGERGARLLVFRVHIAGQPVRVLEEGGAADR